LGAMALLAQTLAHAAENGRGSCPPPEVVLETTLTGLRADSQQAQPPVLDWHRAVTSPNRPEFDSNFGQLIVRFEQRSQQRTTWVLADAPGAGKSTLLRRTQQWWANRGGTALRVDFTSRVMLAGAHQRVNASQMVESILDAAADAASNHLPSTFRARIRRWRSNADLVRMRDEGDIRGVLMWLQREIRRVGGGETLVIVDELLNSARSDVVDRMIAQQEVNLLFPDPFGEELPGTQPIALVPESAGSIRSYVNRLVAGTGVQLSDEAIHAIHVASSGRPLHINGILAELPPASAGQTIGREEIVSAVQRARSRSELALTEGRSRGLSLRVVSETGSRRNPVQWDEVARAIPRELPLEYSAWRILMRSKLAQHDLEFSEDAMLRLFEAHRGSGERVRRSLEELPVDLARIERADMESAIRSAPRVEWNRELFKRVESRLHRAQNDRASFGEVFRAVLSENQVQIDDAALDRLFAHTRGWAESPAMQELGAYLPTRSATITVQDIDDAIRAAQVRRRQ
jgi:hypothetical protein